MDELAVIDEPAAAAAALDPTRARVLEALAEPGSATTLATRLGLSRQKVNYHLRALEAHGLVTLVETRPRRGLTERIVVASARSYVISPAVLGAAAADPSRTDRLSTRYLVAVAARMVREVSELSRRAERERKQLATLSIDTEIRFASAAERAEFTDEIAAAVTSIAARYHDEAAPAGRRHRLVVAAHPMPVGESSTVPPSESSTEPRGAPST